MIVVVVAGVKEVRTLHIKEVLAQSGEGEVIVLDDTSAALDELEQYLYPSLFIETLPIVHAKFLLSSEKKEVDSVFIKKLLASPTIFIFEELALPSSTVQAFKKAGAVVHAVKESTEKKESIFTHAAAMIATTDKKQRWLLYQALLEQHSIEAILGIVYWKVRDLALKDTTGTYRKFYRALIGAHTDSWREGIPLALAIEKVLLA